VKKERERNQGRKERETCSEISFFFLLFFFSGACINPVSAKAGNNMTPKTEAYTVPRE